MDLSMEERVEQGVKWLDSVNEEWVELIDLENLVMSDCQRCVLGQVFHDRLNQETTVDAWNNGIDLLTRTAGSCVNEPAVEFGFDTGYYDTFDELQQEWIEHILERKNR